MRQKQDLEEQSDTVGRAVKTGIDTNSVEQSPKILAREEKATTPPFNAQSTMPATSVRKISEIPLVKD